MDELQPNWAVAFVPKDAGITVAPQSARDHQVVHQIETCGIGVGNLHESVAEVVVLSLATASSTAIEMQRERSDRFGEDSHASPNCREVQCSLLGDIWLARGIGDRIGGNDFIHRSLELGRRNIAPLAPMQKWKPLHYRMPLFETNIAKWFEIWIRQCPLIDI